MNSGDDVALNCDDCFLILEYLAETHHEIEADAEILRTMASKHLSCCPDCRQYYLQRLEQLEEMQKFTDMSSQKGQ
jgi:predicted anti-sigma-YlaC factor YlaD